MKMKTEAVGGTSSWRELSSIPVSQQTPKELRTIPSTLDGHRLTYVKRRRAFTLIEIIVALVLGTLLLSTLMGVLRRSFAEIGVATRDDPSVARLGLLVEQLRRDLTNARKMYVGNNRFELVGFIHRDPLTLIATLRPARVIYEIRQIATASPVKQSGTQSLLVRVQTEDARGMQSADAFTEPVYLGAMNMLVSSNDVRAFSEADRIGLSSVNPSSLLNRRDAVPSSVQIVILDQRGRTILDQTFWRERDAS